MTFDSEIICIPDSRDVLDGETDVNFDDAVALAACQVMMVCAPTDAIMVAAVGEFDTI